MNSPPIHQLTKPPFSRNDDSSSRNGRPFDGSSNQAFDFERPLTVYQFYKLVSGKLIVRPVRQTRSNPPGRSLVSATLAYPVDLIGLIATIFFGLPKEMFYGCLLAVYTLPF